MNYHIQPLILQEGVDMKRIALILMTLFIVASLALAGCKPAEVVEETEVMEEPTEEVVVEEPTEEVMEEPTEEVTEEVVEEPTEAPLGTEENPLIWALVPSGETEDVLAGFRFCHRSPLRGNWSGH